MPMLALMILFLLPSTKAAESDVEQRTLILFDRSASMIQPYEGIRKIDIAKQLFRDLANQLQDDPQVAIRFFAGGTTGDKTADCQASEIGLEFGGVRTASSLASFVDDVKATGQSTPVSFALEQARADLADWPGPRKIVLISDGEETISLVLEHGSLLVMQGTTQTYWQHRLPPTKIITEPRINLTFRSIDC